MFSIIATLTCLLIICQCKSESAAISDKEYGSLPTVFHLDNYDDCMLLEDEAFYCFITYNLHPLDPTHSNTRLWKTLTEVSANPDNYRHDILRHGICVPKTCPQVTSRTEDDPLLYQELTNCYNEKFRRLGVSGNVTDLRCDKIDPKYPVDFIDITVAYLFASYLVLVVVASLYERRLNRHGAIKALEQHSRWKRFLVAFSIPRNWNRLKTVNSSPDTEKLRCIQGVRFYNTVLVILVHTVMALFLIPPVANTRDAETLTDRTSTVFLASGNLCVSTFFLISSFLLMHGIFEKYKDKSELSPKILVKAFINRYLRLTPSLAVVIAFEATWLRHLGSGPNWFHTVGEEYIRCRKNWWTNIFYINNYVDPENMCLHTTWYLSSDTQYFGIVLVIIWYLKKYQNRTGIILGSILALIMLLTFFENYVNDFPALITPTPELLYDMKFTLNNRQWHVQFIGFIGNLAGPIIGLYIGYLYNKYKDKNVFTKRIYIWLWWIVVNTFGWGIVLIPGSIGLSKNIPHNIFWASVHTAVSRSIFAFGIGLTLFGVSQGTGWIIKWILDWPPLYVLGRLTYSAYLIHMPLLFHRQGMLRSPIYFNEYFVICETAGVMAMTYLLATVFTLIFEMPVSELQKLIAPAPNKTVVKTKKHD